MSKKYLAVEALASEILVLDPKRSFYVSVVLRLKPGDKLAVFDRVGKQARATILESNNQHVVMALDELEEREKPSRFLSVALAMPKGARADWAIEKLTEVGVQ